MSAGNDARTYAQALADHVGLSRIYKQAITDKVTVMVASEGATATTINSELHAVEASLRSLEGRLDSLDAAIAAQLSGTEPKRPLVLVPSTEGDKSIAYRTVNEGERPQWWFQASYDPEGTYTFQSTLNTGLEVKWAKITPGAPDLELVPFTGDILTWILWPTANLSVTADAEYEYEFWLEAPDGRRSDIDTQVTDADGNFPEIETVTAKLLVKDTAVVTPPSTGYPVPSTLRRGMGVYIGSSFTATELRSRITGYESSLGMPAGATLAYYHGYIPKAGTWNNWKSTVTALLEGFKSLHDDGGDPGRKLFMSVPPFPGTPMTAADPGWATLQAAGYSSDPLSWAAAAAGAYSWYYKFLGSEILRIYGSASSDIILDLAWEGNATWYEYQYINDGYTRNTALENSAKAARMVFHDQVSTPLQPRGYKVWFAANLSMGAGGAPNSTGWNNAQAAYKATIDTSTLSAVTGRKAVDLGSIDLYPNWSFASSPFTLATTALDAITNWFENTAGIKYYIGETGASFVFRPSASVTATLNGAQAMPRTTITVGSTTGFAASGFLKISSHYFKYTAKTGTTFTGCTMAGSQTGWTASNAAQVQQMNRNGAEDADGALFIEFITDYCEAKRAAGKLVALMWYDADTSATDQFGLLEHKSFSPVLYHFSGSPTGFVGNGTGATAAKYIAEAGGARNQVTS